MAVGLSRAFIGFARKRTTEPTGGAVDELGRGGLGKGSPPTFGDP